MAFGKDKNLLDKVDAFRAPRPQNLQQRHAQRTQARFTGGGGGGGGRPHWVGKWEPTLIGEDKIRCVAGDYTNKLVIEVDKGQYELITREHDPDFCYVEHFDGVKRKSAICSAGPWANFKDKRDPCRGCDERWGNRTLDPQSGKRKFRVSFRSMTALTIFHYAPYAKVPQEDADGHVKTNPDTNEAYMEWRVVLPHERRQFEQYEQRDGMLQHWPMGDAHYNVLLDYNKTVAQGCLNCMTKKAISTLAWICTPCGEAIIDFDSSTLPPDEVQKIVTNPVTCPHCHAREYPSEVISCRNCTPAGGAPRQATIFDVDMYVHRVKSANPDDNGTVLAITDYDLVGIDPRYADIIKPKPLEKIYAPYSMEKQIEIWGAAKASKPMPTGAVPYSR